MKTTSKILSVFALSAALLASGCANNTSSATFDETVTSAEAYSNYMECHTGTLTYDDSYAGTGCMFYLEPESGVTLGESGKYDVYTVFHYTDSVKDEECTWGYVTSGDVPVDVTVADGKVTFTTPVFSLLAQDLFGNSDTGKTARFTCSGVTYKAE